MFKKDDWFGYTNIYKSVILFILSQILTISSMYIMVVVLLGIQ